MISFLPIYMGSKKYWVDKLTKYKDRHFIELFAGSAALTANLAGSAQLNDLDPCIARILQKFDEQIVPEKFTLEDYKRVSKTPDWWQYAYCLQKMSFSGLFRYSKNGYNAAPRKRNPSAEIRPDYCTALARWKKIKPVVTSKHYQDFVDTEAIPGNSVIVSDPPYERSKAVYNSNSFDYPKYWACIESLKTKAQTLIVFDLDSNLRKQNIPVLATKSLVVINGTSKRSSEAMAIYENNRWQVA